MTTPAFRTLSPRLPAQFPLGLGCMGMSDAYGPTDRAESIATIHAALDAGITLFDTGDFYGMGDNEALLAEALAGRRDKAFIQVKFGALRGPDGAFLGFDGRPAAIKSFITYSLRRLKTDYIDLYQPARLDPSVPIEDTVGAIADLIKAGYVRYLGLSEMGVDTIRRAHAVHPVAALQIEYSLMTRTPEHGILATLAELGIGLTAYGVLGRGLISRTPPTAASLAPTDFRSHTPRFQGDNLDRNRALVAALTAVADSLGASVAQVAIAWVLARRPFIVPLVGARTRERLQEALGVLHLRLSSADLARVEAACPPEAVAGTRYAAVQMQMLDSERAVA